MLKTVPAGIRDVKERIRRPGALAAKSNIVSLPGRMQECRNGRCDDGGHYKILFSEC